MNEDYNILSHRMTSLLSEERRTLIRMEKTKKNAIEIFNKKVELEDIE